MADVALPGQTSRFDYQSLDPVRRLLFIAHLGDDEVVVVDTRNAQPVARIGGVSQVHGILVVPALDRVFASATGQDAVVVIDEATFKIRDRVAVGHHPDGLAYAPQTGRIYVSDKLGDCLSVIDGRSDQLVATIPLGGHVGNVQYDPKGGHIFANVQTLSQLAEVDPLTQTVVRRIPLPGAHRNHGLQFSAGGGFAFITSQDDAKLLVLDMATGQVTARFAIGADPDVLAFDPGAGLLYVAGESGIVSMFTWHAGRLVPAGQGLLGPDAHSVAVDPASHETFFPLMDVAGRPVLRIMAPRHAG